MSNHQALSQAKFAWTCLILQICFGILFVLLVRYSESADARHTENQKGEDHDLKHNLEKYPAILDVHMMLVGGFGFLMTFLKRFGFSALGMTLMIVAIVTEWSILLWGFTKMENFTIHLNMMEILEAGLTSAAVLISFGALLGKLNPFQTLILALIESTVFVANAYLGYKVLGTLDIGGAIFIHAFGAYFGIAVALVLKKDYSRSEELEGSVYQSDITAMLGTVFLWIFWPSFNAILADNDAYHRAIINTYISLLGSTISTFIFSTLFGNGRRLDMVDIQNATLSGGVAVGAIADLMIQPYGAFLAGTLTGIVSCLGYRLVQPFLFRSKIGLHDTCGVNNLHGMPGLISGFLSIFFCYLASEETYGDSFFMIFPRAAPNEGNNNLRELQKNYPGMIEPGENRTMETQALMQLAALVITIVISVVSGMVTGILLNVQSVFHNLGDGDYFDDAHFWHIPLENHMASAKEETPLQTFKDFAPQPSRVVQQEEGKED